jgi:hypothetical protein
MVVHKVVLIFRSITILQRSISGSGLGGQVLFIYTIMMHCIEESFYLTLISTSFLSFGIKILSQVSEL